MVSLYTPDVNTVRAIQYIEQRRPVILFTEFGELELENAFGLRVFRKEITVAESKSAHNAFAKDAEAGVFQLRPVTEAIYERARRLSRNRTAQLGARTGDILHVAAALVLGSELFLTFDKQQEKLAIVEGCKVL